MDEYYSELHRALKHHINDAGLYFFSVLVSCLYVLSENNDAKEAENKENIGLLANEHMSLTLCFLGLHCKQYIFCQV